MRKLVHYLLAVCLFHVTTIALLSDLKASFETELEEVLIPTRGARDHQGPRGVREINLTDFSGPLNSIDQGRLDEQDLELLGITNLQPLTQPNTNVHRSIPQVDSQSAKPTADAGSDIVLDDVVTGGGDIASVQSNQEDIDAASTTSFEEEVRRDLEQLDNSYKARFLRWWSGPWWPLPDSIALPLMAFMLVVVSA